MTVRAPLPGGDAERAPADVAVREAVQERVDGVVDRTVEQAVEEQAVVERVDEVVDDAVEEAVQRAAPDDPVLDTTLRRMEARADDDNPFGRLGRPMSRRSPFRIGFTGALGVALAYGLMQAVIAVHSVLVLLLVAAFLAIGLDPAVQGLERRGLRRSRAVGIVLLGVVLFFAVFAMAVVPPIIDQGQQFVEAAPGYVQELQSNPRIAEFDRRYGVLDRLSGALSDPERLGATVFGGVLGVGKVVVGTVFSTLAVLILTLYFLANLPSIRAHCYRLVPRSRRARVGLLSDEVLSRVGGYVAGAMTIAAIAGGSTFLLLVLLGVPYPLALAMLVAVTDLVPLVGATFGAAVVLLVALSVSAKVVIALAVYYVAYQQLENYVLYPRVMQRSVDVSPAATVVAVLVGGSLLGVVGALLAIPMAAAVQLLVNEVVVPRQDAG